jgi:hypothetical protein
MTLAGSGGNDDGDGKADDGGPLDALGLGGGGSDDRGEADDSSGGLLGGSRAGTGDAGPDDEGGPATAVADGVADVRDRVDPRATAETAARGAIRLALRVVGAVAMAYGLWLLVAVEGWTRLAAGALAAGFLPAFAPGVVVGLAAVVWKVFSLA